MKSGLLTTQAGRQHLVDTFLAFTRDTPLAAPPREQALLTQFIQGALTIDQVVQQLEEGQSE